MSIVQILTEKGKTEGGIAQQSWNNGRRFHMQYA